MSAAWRTLARSPGSCSACASAGGAPGQAAGHDVHPPALAARCRDYLGGVFRPRSDAPAVTGACRPHSGSYLAARTAAVTALAAAAAVGARQAGVRLTLLDETVPMQAYATGQGVDPKREL